MAGCRRHSLLTAVVAAALVVYSIAQTAKTQPNQQLNLTNTEAYPITQLPNCKVAKDNSHNLPAGLLDNACNIQMQLKPLDPQLFMFSIPDSAEMSAGFTLSVQGGTASMSIWYPGSSVEGPPDLVQSEFYISIASSEGWISIKPADLKTHTGQYLLSVTAFSGSPSVQLRVTSPGPEVMLADLERELLLEVAAQCCDGEAKGSDFCSFVVPKSLKQAHAWTSDLCHMAPNSCNKLGQLTRFVLPTLGLSCPTFPKQLGQLPALTHLDLRGNSFGQATFADVAEVLSGLPALTGVALSDTGMTGSLTCDLSTIPTLQFLDVAYNYLEGPLPACLLNNLTELYVSSNALSGTLPAVAANISPLKLLYANQQRGAGITGTIPASFSALQSLAYLNLGGNSLKGSLPALPTSIKLVDVSSNTLSGKVDPLPVGAWHMDISKNSFTGMLPGLSSYEHLQVFLAGNNPNMQGPVPTLPANLLHLELAGCGLTGTIPSLPAGIRHIDLSDNSLKGLIQDIDTSQMEVFRAANNSLTGPLPGSISFSSRLFLVDLHSNRLSGPLPDSWVTPAMQMIMLEDNAFTGTIPPALASLHRLGVLRLGNNKLTGSLTDFATALPAASSSNGSSQAPGSPAPRRSSVFDFNVTSNQLTGPVPAELARLGVFDATLKALILGIGGAPAAAPRALDLSANKLAGDWPIWLLKAVPSVLSVCGCSITANMSGSTMKLNCPKSELHVSGYSWQVAAEQRYTCYNPQNPENRQQQQVLDYLVSGANSGDNLDTSSNALGGGGGLYGSTKQWHKLSPGAAAGVAVAVLIGVGLLGALSYFVVFKNMIKTRKATAFKKFTDDHEAAAAGGAGAVAASDGQQQLQTPL